MDIPLTLEEIEIMEHFFTPTSLTENLVPLNENAPQTWHDGCSCITLRPYQIMMQNFSYLVADDPELNEQQNFNKKKGAGDLYSIGSRNTGKSFLLKIDAVLSFIHGIREACIASFDALHLKNVTEPVSSYIESHPFCQIFHLRNSNKSTVSRQPFLVKSEHGSLIKGVNEKIDSDNPGVGFHSLHSETAWYEEFSYCSEEGDKKRVDAGSSLGCIERFSGIPDLRIGSPMTKILQNDKLKNWIWRLPQYCRPDYGPEMKEQQILKYGGENSIGYRLNVEAEIIEGAFGFWDMARLKEKCFKSSKRVKYFEISKDIFTEFDKRIIVERLPGAEKVFIDADIGLGASPTEIIINFEKNEKLYYSYNISLFKLIQKEQAQIFKWLYDKLGGAFISCDSTGDGGVVIDMLYDLGVPRENLLKVKFNENIEVDFDKDEEGRINYDKNGKEIMIKVNTLDFAMQQLERIIYEGKIEIPLDEKFFKEFNGFMVKMTGTRKVYGSSTTDHLHQSFQCLAINKYFNEFNSMANQRQTKRCYGVFS